MINYVILKIKNKYLTIISLIYQIKIQFFFKILHRNKKYSNEETKILKNQGYLHLKEIIPKREIDNFFQLYEKEILHKSIKNNDYLIEIPIKFDEKNIFFDYLKNRKVFDICKDYLGKIQIINGCVNHQTNLDCETSSMQPHNDTRGNDLKIYICLSDFNDSAHPLYYLRGSHNDLKFYILEKHHRRKYISKEKMDKIYGKKGDIIIFDTHGWHSHIKKNTTERTVLDITLIPNNYFFKSENANEQNLVNL